MDTRTTRPRRKQYVEVVACHGIDGSVSPQTITIVGSKTYQIESASQPKESFDPLLDGDAIRYRVRMHEMLKAVRTTSAMRSRAIVCPYCGHKMFTVYEGSTGYVQTKCNKCKKISPINLVSMRRVRRARDRQ